MKNYDLATQLIEQDIKWLHEESDPTVFNAWIELLLFEGFKGYRNMTEKELLIELKTRQSPEEESA